MQYPDYVENLHQSFKKKRGQRPSQSLLQSKLAQEYIDRGIPEIKT